MTIAVLHGIQAEPGPLPGTDLAPDANGWRREPVWRYEGGCSTGDFTVGWEYEALYINERYGVAVEVVAYISHDPATGADPTELWAAERIGTGRYEDGEIEIDDYDHDTLDAWVQSTMEGWDDVVRNHALADIRQGLTIPRLSREAEIAEALEVKKRIHRTLQRMK